LASEAKADQAPAHAGRHGAGLRAPRVYLHIGEPKTGTTFLQDLIWTNRGLLARRGIVLPGYDRYDHSRASRDLRGAPRESTDSAEPWIGEWDVLVREAKRAPVAALVSDEVLAACRPKQAERAVRSLLSTDLHIIATVRDFGSVLPAEWQESIKVRGTVPWDAWLKTVVEAEPEADRRRRSWFWTMHDTLANLAMWSEHLAPDHVHVVTVPRDGSADVLWVRFASVLGIDPGGVDLSHTRSNSSLGLMDAEFLRRLNEALPADVPDWFYTRNIKRLLAHEVLSARPGQARVALPPELTDWAKRQADQVIEGLTASGYHIVGDVGDLLPRPANGDTPQADDAPVDRMLDAAVRATAALAEQHYHQMYLEEPKEERSFVRALGHLRWIALNGPRVQHVLKSGSQRRVVRSLRVVIWQVLVRPGRYRR
jgi:hypothetical protein